MTDDENGRVDSHHFLRPQVRILRTVAEQWITRHCVYEIKVGGIYSQFLPNGEAAQITKIVLRANSLRVAQSILSQFLELG